jgi:diadenosine tetraphosphate (Ap4A) HIT family hydrolase
MIHIWSRQAYKDILQSKEMWNEPHNCPFCNISKNPDQIIWEGKNWYIVYNIFPYSGNEQHIMAIPKSHICYSSDISSEMWSEFGEVQRVIKDFYAGHEYFSFTRETFSGRSLEHYHMHFLPGTLKWKFLRKMLELQGFPITQELIL